MSAAVSLSSLLDARRVWRGRAEPAVVGEQPTGWALLDAVLPSGGWPVASLSEILLPLDGVGELQLVLPTLARLSRGARPLVLVTPPYAPCVAGWRQHGVDMRRIEIVTRGRVGCAVGNGAVPALGQLRGGAGVAAAGR